MIALQVPPNALHVDWRHGLPRLANDRVLLRELERHDAAELFRIVSSPDVARHTWPGPSNVAAFEEFIEGARSARSAGKYVAYGIVPHGSTRVVGLFELRSMQPEFLRAELGFFIDAQWWGTGLFDSAARLVIQFATEVVGVHRIEARSSVGNTRSNAALRKIGARKEGVLRAAFIYNGKCEDQNLWAIVRGLDTQSNLARRGRSSGGR
jgi:RimJ/RimL family protein N-acetyltransferase